jgi:hypothetical protein
MAKEHRGDEDGESRGKANKQTEVPKGKVASKVSIKLTQGCYRAP